jgi:hypothetical protein
MEDQVLSIQVSRSLIDSLNPSRSVTYSLVRTFSTYNFSSAPMMHLKLPILNIRNNYFSFHHASSGFNYSPRPPKCCHPRMRSKIHTSQRRRSQSIHYLGRKMCQATEDRFLLHRRWTEQYLLYISSMKTITNLLQLGLTAVIISMKELCMSQAPAAN